jgi:hypothetical protein
MGAPDSHCVSVDPREGVLASLALGRLGGQLG